MDLLSTFLVASLVTLVTVVGYSDATITVTVDPDSGNDTACLSISESASENSTDLVPCRTLNKALGTVAGQTHCRNVSCEVGALVDFEDEAVIRLEDGKHKLSGEQYTQLASLLPVRVMAKSFYMPNSAFLDNGAS